jgi:arylsulfatase A-like enzyme
MMTEQDTVPMKRRISRRDFIKLSSLLSTTYFFPRFQAAEKTKNVLVLVFDALSAPHISHYGYPRQTMPKLGKWLEHATVFHNHYAGGTFTTPGTATLLTGTLPWTSRAFNVDGDVAPQYVDANIFNKFSSQGYYGFAYTHNPLADLLLRQFRASIDEYFPEHQFFLENNWLESLLINDIDTAVLSARQIITDTDRVSNALFLTRPYGSMVEKRRQRLLDAYQDNFPNGLPSVGSSRYFILEDSIDWLVDNIDNTPSPFIGYFHFFPPHHPYTTRREFVNSFDNDGYVPIDKPEHLFPMGETLKSEKYFRRKYDQSILYADAEFNRLFEHMQNSGILQDTWVVLTSDHGEMFERRCVGHTTESFFDPVVHIPLVIFEPGAQQRRDIYQPTSAVDILPTLLHVTGNPLPQFTEGQVLPPYNEDTIPLDRSIFGLHGRYNPQYKPLETASAMHLKWPYKLVAYWGYEKLKGEPMYELFNLEEDREELANLYREQPQVAAGLLDEINRQIDQADRPYK